MKVRLPMKEESIFLEHVGDSPRMRVIQYFIEGRDFDYTLTDLLNAGVSWGTVNLLIPKLVAIGIIVKTRKIGRATLYKINQQHPTAKKLMDLYDELILQEVDKIEKQTHILAH